MLIDKKAVGVIEVNGTSMGTAFVFIDKRTVITCHHVVEKDKKSKEIDINAQILYCSGNPLQKKRLILCKPLPAFDLVVFSSEEDLCEMPLECTKTFAPHAKQNILYYGYDVASSKNKIILRKVASEVVEVGQKKGTLIDYITFGGQGTNGYSGGPILDEFGKVIAVFDSSWDNDKMHSGYSILPIL